MKNISITILVILLLALTACSGNAETASDAGANSSTGGTAQELPLSTKLSIGTLKLENTDQAIASSQAADLLPLWQVLNSLNASDSVAPEEITAITKQIQETMTPEQIATIDDMGLTPEDIFATMQELGLTTGQPNAEGGQQPPAGGRPEGGFPGGGPGGQEFTPEQIATAQARKAEGGGMNTRMLTPLVEAVIELLESKVQ